MSDSARAYDDIPYPHLACPLSHPGRMAAVATLFGLTPAPATACRVLEIGCASGGNLLPMAATLPGSRFTGLDISPAQIAAAVECAAALPLENVALVTGSLADFEAETGSFDYIIAHGVYSWVEAPLRASLLALCGRLLAPHGVAYISYNALPGGGMRHAMRQLARLNARGIPAARDQVAAARNVFGVIERAVEGRSDPHALLVRAEMEQLRQVDDAYIAHEHLEDANEPCWFHEFAAAAAGHGLQYLGEAELHSMGTAGLAPAAAEALRRTARDLIEAEQFLDFLRNRSFRQTLLCRAGVDLKRSIATSLMDALYVTCAAKPVHSAGPGEFQASDGTVIRVNDPLTRAAILELSTVWPLPLPFPELAERAAGQAGLAADAASQRKLALQFLNLCAGSSLIDLSTHPPPFQTALSAFPKALPLARWQAQRGRPLVNGRHENLHLGDAGRALLQLLDGTRPLEEITNRPDAEPKELARIQAAALLERLPEADS